MPLIVVNDFGKGKAVFMNVETGRYPYERLATQRDTSLPEVVEQIFGLWRTFEPSVRVLDAAGNRLPGTEVVRFANGAVEHVAVFRNPQFDDGGWGDLPTMTEREWAGSIDNSLSGKRRPSHAVMVLGPSHLRCPRRRRDLGETAKVQLSSTPGARWC